MSRDLRKYARQTNFRVLVLIILAIVVLGEAFIYFVYGPAATVTGLICFGGAIIPLLLIWLFLKGMDWIVKRGNEQ
ncbi:MAG: hypothetical protein JXB38_04800 [Anaerolineales bacterium]|nr:hypothetical protein [Anaerolineales bacterium]